MDGVIYLFTPNWMKRVVQLSHTIPVVLLSEKSDDIPLNTISLNGFTMWVSGGKVSFGSGTQEYRFPDELCFFGLPDPYETSGGYQKCHSRCGSAAGNASGFFTAPLGDSGQSEAEAGYSIMEQLLKRKDITAVIGVNDLVAFGALSCVLNSEDKRVPQDVSICGFDNIYLTTMTRPKIHYSILLYRGTL